MNRLSEQLLAFVLRLATDKNVNIGGCKPPRFLVARSSAWQPQLICWRAGHIYGIFVCCQELHYVLQDLRRLANSQPLEQQEASHLSSHDFVQGLQLRVLPKLCTSEHGAAGNEELLPGCLWKVEDTSQDTFRKQVEDQLEATEVRHQRGAAWLSGHPQGGLRCIVMQWLDSRMRLLRAGEASLREKRRAEHPIFGPVDGNQIGRWNVTAHERRSDGPILTQERGVEDVICQEMEPGLVASLLLRQT
mmetsp:Transcript_33485/g.80327  ORF Transcript_33485/g.80327 Transcript_33485/m.80327 type:complete len:247 (-) Transcript_33485:169-909(-)